MPAIIPDTLPQTLVDDVMDKGTLEFTTRSEHRRAMKERGLINMVRHVGVPGSDKSPHTSNWHSVLPDYLTPEGEARRLAHWYATEPK